MTIERGSEWGEIVTDRAGGIEPHGDLARDLGITDVSRHVGEWRRLPLDIIEVSAVRANGTQDHLATTGWVRCGHRFASDLVIVSSTAFVDGRRLFSRAHPNDGRFDWMTIAPTMPLRQRWAFWRRTRTETHFPHPLVSTGSGTRRNFSFPRPKTLLTSDGARLSGVIGFEARILPDAAVTHIPSL